MLAIIGPWLVQSMELPGSESIADALISTLPPQVQQVLSAQDDPMTVVRQMAQQIGELQQQLQQAQQQLQHGGAEQVKAQTQMQLKQMDIQAEIEKKKMDIESGNQRQQTDLMAKMQMRDADSHDAHTRAILQSEDSRMHDMTKLGMQHARDDAKAKEEREERESQAQAQMIQSILTGVPNER
jgi:hypothetical protein